MKTDHIEHDLFLLMLHLSQIQDSDRIKTIFIDSVNSLSDSFQLKFLSEQDTANSDTLRVATAKNAFGRIQIRTVRDHDLPDSIKALLRNAISMLALILEHRLHERLISDERLVLAEAVNERTRELEVSNREMRKEVAERKKAEEELARIFSMSLDMICIADINTAKFIKINPAFTETLGFSEEELLGKSFLDFIHPADIGPTLKMIEDKLKKGKKVIRFENRYRCRDNSYRWLNWTSHPVPAQGITYAVARDISDRIQFEKEREKLEIQLRQSQKMEAIGTLAGGIAHDFNNLLGIILGYTELTLDDLSERSVAYQNLAESRTACLRARELIRQLLNFCRKSEPEKEPVNLVRLIQEAMKLIRASIPASVRIRQSLDMISDTVLANPTQMNQVLLNLCSNAAQAMNFQGQLHIALERAVLDREYVKIVRSLKPGHYAKLSVSDTGCGIAPEHLDKIFDPYFTTKAVGKGSGMGLSVVYGIVKAHDGAITVYSEVGKGSVFNVYLPVSENEAKKTVSASGEIPTGHEKILLVDDEQMLVTLGQRLLSSLGYEVECKNNPSEALALFRLKPDDFDLVITDMTMPDLPGDKLALELMKLRPDLPIILCTGHSEMISKEIAEKIGIRKYLMKPLTKRKLARAIREVLDEV